MNFVKKPHKFWIIKMQVNGVAPSVHRQWNQIRATLWQIYAQRASNFRIHSCKRKKPEFPSESDEVFAHFFRLLGNVSFSRSSFTHWKKWHSLAHFFCLTVERTEILKGVFLVRKVLDAAPHETFKSCFLTVSAFVTPRQNVIHLAKF